MIHISHYNIPTQSVRFKSMISLFINSQTPSKIAVKVKRYRNVFLLVSPWSRMSRIASTGSS